MVVTLVPQNPHQPCPRGGLAAETVLRFDRPQKRVLNEVFGGVRIAHLVDVEVEKVIRVGVHPIAAESRLTLSVRHQIGFVFHSDCPYRNGCATKPQIRANH